MRKSLRSFSPAALLPAAITLATLTLLPAWDAALAVNARFAGWGYSVTLISGTLAVALAFWVLLLLARKGGWPAWLALPVFAAAMLLAGGDLAGYLGPILKDWGLALSLDADAWERELRILALTAAFMAAMLAAARPGGSVKAVVTALQILSPLPVVLAFQLGAQPGAAIAHASVSAPGLPGREVERTVVWLVLDELDQEMMDRELSALPAFSWLKKHSLVAENAFPPANLTSLSVPSMLLGEPLNTEIRRSGVRFQREGSEAWEELGPTGHFFARLRDSGRSMSISGWHLPYCNMFGSLAAECLDDSMMQAPGGPVGLWEWMYGHNWLTQRLWRTYLAARVHDMGQYYPAFFGLPWLYHNRRYDELQQSHAQFALRAMASKRYDAIYAHMLCPHLPRLEAASLPASLPASSPYRPPGFVQDYAANLRVCDGLLARMLKALDDAKYPGGYVLVVSSDHWFRCLDWLDQGRTLVMPGRRRSVPLMIHSSLESGQPHRVTHVFNVVGLGGVVERIVNEGIGSHAAIAALLERLEDRETRLTRW